MLISLIIQLALLLCSAAARNISNRESYLSCLGCIKGLLVLSPTDSEYQNARLANNRRFSYFPAAIIYPTCVDQVQQAVKCASAADISVVARSGGHSYAAYGLGGKDGSLVVDLSKTKSLHVDKKTGYAVSQTGNMLGDVAQGIWDQARRALPHGTCPYVGSGGHTSYGGFGMFSRTAGLLLDRVIEAEVVLANGEAVIASNTSHPDLFWALRGAAPSFGIVTSWTFATFPAPTQNIYWCIDYSSPLDRQKAAQALLALQNFAASNPSKKLSIACTLERGDSSGISLSFGAVFYGSESDFLIAIAPLRDALPNPSKFKYKMVNWLEGLEAVSGSLDTSKPEPYDTYYAKSLFVMPDKLVTDAAILSWVDFMIRKGSTTELSWWVDIRVAGGVVSSVAEDATAYAHRDAILMIQVYGGTPGGKGKFPPSGITFVDGLLGSLDPCPKAAYPNFIDPTLTETQWENEYYGTTKYQKLSQIKGKYDPTNVFNFPQAIQPA